jgi:peptidyl-prolyl cis-trans isomerase B (cyclophilin B)
MLTRPRTALAVLAVVASLALVGCGSDESDNTATDPATDTSTATPTPTPQGPACKYTPDAQGAAKEVSPPPDHATVSGQVDLDMVTSAGDIGLELDADTTPCTVNSFVSLADQGYFDDTTCHRLTTAQSGIFVLQCGDPMGTGVGGPGYSFDDELSGDETYPAGTVAMANAGPNTNGSQFFLVYDETPLPASYTVFGQLDDDGLKVVQDIAAQGTADGGPDGAPKETVSIESITVSD